MPIDLHTPLESIRHPMNFWSASKAFESFLTEEEQYVRINYTSFSLKIKVGCRKEQL